MNPIRGNSSPSCHSILHMFVAVHLISGKAHECPVLYRLVEQFVEVMGKGVLQRLILDRGFLDGQAISRCNQQLGIDVLIPVRRNMDIYRDAKALFQMSDVEWVSQKFCRRQECQQARKRQWTEEKLNGDEAYRFNQAHAEKLRRQRNPGYWRQYRQKNAAYTERNREQQRERNRRLRSKSAPVSTDCKHGRDQETRAGPIRDLQADSRPPIGKNV